MKKEIIVLMFLSFISMQSKAEFSIGLGLGVPYGVLGTNLNYSINEKIDVSVGIGSTIVAGMGTSIGARFYPMGSESGLRFSLFHGTNAILEEPSCAVCDDFESYKGWNVGVGWDWSRYDGGWDLDVIYIMTSKAFDRADELEKNGNKVSGSTEPGVRFSVGYHWASF